MLFGDYIIPQKEELDYLLGFVKFSFFLSEAATASLFFYAQKLKSTLFTRALMYAWIRL
jgi:hypothetical protein